MDPAYQSCLFFLERLGQEVVRLKCGPFPGHHTGPQKWLEFVLGAVDTAKGYLEKSTDSSVSKSEKEKLVTDAEMLSGTAYYLLSFVAGSDAKNIPQQVVAPFRRWVESLKIINTIFFRAEHFSNYEITTIDPAFLSSIPFPSNSYTEALNAICWPVQLITVPSQSMAILPHFAVVAHELGHSIQDQIEPDFNNISTAESNFYARVGDRLKKAGLTFDTKVQLRCTQIADNWVNEFKADAVGYILVGPAFFFALSSFLELIGSGYGVAPTHPPSDLRLNKLLKALESGGNGNFNEIFFKHSKTRLSLKLTCPNLALCPSVDDLYNELKDQHGIVDAAICAELIAFFDEAAHPIFVAAEEYIEQIAPEIVYKASQYELDIERHLELLLMLVPPIEFLEGDKIKPSGMAAILNIGWFALLTKIDQMPSVKISKGQNPTAQKVERLHELLLKAVELSEARRIWEEHSS